MNKIIEFEDTINAETIWFFSKSENNLFRNCGNSYTCKMRGKYILVDRKIAKDFPDSCYLKVKQAIEKDNVFIITDAGLITTSETASKDIAHFDIFTLVQREDYAIKDTIKYYNCKSKKGDIDCLVVTYKMHTADLQKTYFDSYINFNGKIIRVEAPNNIYDFYRYDKTNDFASVDYYDFVRIK